MVTVTKHTYTTCQIADEGGQTVAVAHTITLSSGTSLRFSERNIFDFGRVINPLYAVAEDLEPGGLCNVRDGVQVWETFGVDKYRLPDGREAERDEALEWALTTIPDGLPEGYSITTERVPNIWGDGMVEEVVLHYPASETWFWDRTETYEHSMPAARESARRHHAGCIINPMRIQSAGWYVVRPLTEEEQVAMKYLWDHGRFAGAGIRMDTDEDLAEQRRVERDEASLELACEEGIIPGALPADL